ncbi:MAG TPA: DNA-processing protein DprA [Casimicrobiaceae bacterium]|nr:DNA-processing protein DprA [Casimicrobiaceae bacterium]
MPSVDPHREAWASLALRAIPPSALVALLREFAGPAGVLAATRKALAGVVPEPIVARLARPVPPDLLARTLAWLGEPGHELVAWGDASYPQALLAIGHPPPVLFYVGRADLLNHPALAIVGSRSATAQGRDNARAFARAISEAGLTVVSGLATGIDGAAHEGGLEGASSTLAVVATGLDRVYPARHRELAHRIAEHGTLVSEFPPGTPPREQNFPRRNRLISGLSRGVLVVEAALHSGSLITARYAGEQGREVFAIPGSIHSPVAKGCHKLLREGAKLVETAVDILEELGMAPGLQSAAEAPISQSAVLAAMGDDPADIDTLIARTGLSADSVVIELTSLELAGAAAPLPGGSWQRRRP